MRLQQDAHKQNNTAIGFKSITSAQIDQPMAGRINQNHTLNQQNQPISFSKNANNNNVLAYPHQSSQNATAAMFKKSMPGCQTSTSINLPRGTHPKRTSFARGSDNNTTSNASANGHHATIGGSKFQIHPILQGAPKNQSFL